jgi:uncharacterized membrane protein
MVQLEIAEEIRKKARNPHELFMLNLALFHLLLAPVSFFMVGSVKALLIPLTVSCIVITFIYLRGRKAEQNSHWFEMIHWKLAFRRGRLLLIAYSVTALIITAGWLIALGIDKQTSKDIITTIFSRIGIMPTFILVVVTFVLESGSIHQAGRGEIQEGMVKRHPIPDDIKAVEG